MTAAADSLARTVLGKNLGVRQGESVVIETWPHTLEYARSFVEETRRLGAVPTLLYEDEPAWWTAVEEKTFRPFTKLSKAEKAALAKTDVYVHFFGPEDQNRLSSLPSAIREKPFAWNEEWYDAARRGHLRGTRMSIGLVPDGLAQKFGMSSDELREKLVKAGSVDAAKMAQKGSKLQRAVQGGSELRLRHSNGTDLTIQLNGVQARADVGIVDASARKRRYGILANNPTGLLMVAVDRSMASGRILGNRPVYDLETARRYAGADWSFQAGKIVQRTLRDGGKEFEKAFAEGGKGRDALSYFSIGLNPEGFAAAPAEDTEEGAVLLSVGNNTFAGGTNRAKMRGFAMVAGADIDVDGKSIVASGRIR